MQKIRATISVYQKRCIYIYIYVHIIHYFKDLCIDQKRAQNLCEHYRQNHLGRACPRHLPYPPEIKLAKKSPPQHGPRITD